jgi:hypothetical protein
MCWFWRSVWCLHRQQRSSTGCGHETSPSWADRSGQYGYIKWSTTSLPPPDTPGWDYLALPPKHTKTPKYCRPSCLGIWLSHFWFNNAASSPNHGKGHLLFTWNPVWKERLLSRFSISGSETSLVPWRRRRPELYPQLQHNSWRCQTSECTCLWTRRTKGAI